ncbi:MAG: hypothetical protein U0529_21190 [Thermoanaerobaculia bacterium]
MNVPSTCRRELSLRVGIAAVALVLALAGLADPALAETRGTATISFPFVAGSTSCPAGSYTFDVDGTKVTLRSTEPKGPAVVLLVLTRLGRHDKDKEPEFVFDKVGNQMKLSEIWPPGEDGLLTLLTPEYHEHRVVGGSNPHN